MLTYAYITVRFVSINVYRKTPDYPLTTDHFVEIELVRIDGYLVSATRMRSIRGSDDAKLLGVSNLRNLWAHPQHSRAWVRPLHLVYTQCPMAQQPTGAASRTQKDASGE